MSNPNEMRLTFPLTVAGLPDDSVLEEDKAVVALTTARAARDLQQFGQQGDYVLPVCGQHALTLGGSVAGSESAYGARSKS